MDSSKHFNVLVLSFDSRDRIVDTKALEDRYPLHADEQ